MDDSDEKIKRLSDEFRNDDNIGEGGEREFARD